MGHAHRTKAELTSRWGEGSPPPGHLKGEFQETALFHNGSRRGRGGGGACAHSVKCCARMVDWPGYGCVCVLCAHGEGFPSTGHTLFSLRFFVPK